MEAAYGTQSRDQRGRLNNIYRNQRHFYDLTRRFFLFGRDELIERIEINKGDRVLEIGCGTGRNLVILSKLNPEAKFYGLDGSAEMLKTASSKVKRHRLTGKVFLREGLAEELNAQETFGLSGQFDSIFCSYTLSMVPEWRMAIDAALANLKPEAAFI